MHRQPLIVALERYATLHPDEAETCARFLDFVRTVPSCFERHSWSPGHVTASAWLVDPDGANVLLTHHKKLGRWLQLGGHSDGNSNTLATAIREAQEESGLAVKPLAADIFDIDIHEIPARKADPTHLHFDVRHLLRSASKNYSVSDESNNLAWVPIGQLSSHTDEVSVTRMADKWRAGGWNNSVSRHSS